MQNKYTPIENVMISDFVLEEIAGLYGYYKSIEDAESGADREYGYTGDYLDVEFNEQLTYVLQQMR